MDKDGENIEFVAANLDDASSWTEYHFFLKSADHYIPNLRAVRGVDYVLHVASPFPLDAPLEIIDTAVTGTINVLQVCMETWGIGKMSAVDY